MSKCVLLMLLILTYFLTRCFTKSKLWRVFSMMLSEVAAWRSLLSCRDSFWDFSLWISAQYLYKWLGKAWNFMLSLRIIVKTPYKYENLTSNEEVDHAVNLNMCKRSQQCVLDPFGDWDSHWPLKRSLEIYEARVDVTAPLRSGPLQWHLHWESLRFLAETVLPRCNERRWMKGQAGISPSLTSLFAAGGFHVFFPQVYEFYSWESTELFDRYWLQVDFVYPE